MPHDIWPALAWMVRQGAGQTAGVACSYLGGAQRVSPSLACLFVGGWSAAQPCRASSWGRPSLFCEWRAHAGLSPEPCTATCPQICGQASAHPAAVSHSNQISWNILSKTVIATWVRSISVQILNEPSIKNYITAPRPMASSLHQSMRRKLCRLIGSRDCISPLPSHHTPHLQTSLLDPLMGRPCNTAQSEAMSRESSIQMAKSPRH